MLLLGAGESGKSTVIKQVKILYKTGISAEEAAQYTKSIRNNAIECMAVLLEACARFDLPIDSEHQERKESGSVRSGPGIKKVVYKSCQVGVRVPFFKVGFGFRYHKAGISLSGFGYLTTASIV